MSENAQQIYPWEIITETCRCGHGVGHEDVVVEKQFGTWMQLAALLGVTPVPKRVIFYCRKCRKEFAQTTDPVVRNFYAT